jgi:(2S)-methylsuccinyl-CoA dehydrogenase
MQPHPALLLSELEAAFAGITRALALRCATAGDLDAAKLNANQFNCYELAFACSELLAAKAVLATGPQGGSALSHRLTLSFLAEALPSALQRLESLALDLNFYEDELAAVQRGAALKALRRAGTGAEMETTGKMLLESNEEIALVETNEEVDIARHAFRRFAREVVAPLAAAIHRENLTVPEAMLGPMRDMGVFGLSIPQRYGGTAADDGEDNLAMIAITEALSEASLAAAGSLITRPEILTRAMLAGATERQKRSWLPRIAAGEPLCAIAITEPDFGSDVASLSLRGTRAEGGWTLHGAKTWCTFAGKAGVLMVVVRTDANHALGHKGLSVLLVEKPSYDGHEFAYEQGGGGKLTGRAIPTIGYRGMHSFDLSFENFFVPDTNVLGEEAGLGRGFYLTMAGMTGGRMQTAARACGVMRAALTVAMSYARDRKVFGAKLAEYQLTRVKLARMAARFAACRRLVYMVGGMLNQGGGQMEASLVKLFACRSAEWVTREAMQIHGGMGYAEESAASRYFVDARVLSIFEGAEETLALKVVARELLQRALVGSAR